ncbi:MAG: fatty acid desaturase [Erythrobacter sp.]
MSHSEAVTPENRPNPRTLAKDLNSYTSPHRGRSIWELAITLVPFVIVFVAMLFAVEAGYYIALAMTPVAGMLLLRLFIIQHDCGHGSYFAKKSWNRWVGRAMGTLTLTPYDCWQRSHALHHANTGNLDARGFGDVDTLTVREFAALSRTNRFLYRLYRHPTVLMGLGPAYLFLLRHRLPIGLMREGWKYWISAMGTNLATAAILGGLVFGFGLSATLIVFLPVLLTAASVGVWLFYVQHQFEHSYWERKKEWTFHEAAMGSSSYLALPTVFRWFTGNIGIHHVHHLASRIPFYRLPDVLKSHPELADFNRLSPMDGLRSMVLTLWDEESGRLVSFREAKRLAA